MSTYRTGADWGVTIVREPAADATEPCTNDGDHPGHALCAQLVAVVVNGDQALAERICTLLNGVTVTPAAEHAFHSAAAAARTMPRHEGYATHDGLCAALRALGFEVTPIALAPDSCVCSRWPYGPDPHCPYHDRFPDVSLSCAEARTNRSAIGWRKVYGDDA